MDLISAVGEIVEGIGSNAFLQRAADVLDSRLGLGFFQLQSIDMANARFGETLFSRDEARAVKAEYESEILPVDPRIPSLLTRLGAIEPCYRVVDSDAFERTDVGRWLDQPHVDARWCAAGILPVGAGEAIVMATFRSRRQGAFDENGLAILRAASPALVRACQVHLRVSAAVGPGSAMLEGCARRGEAAFLIDSDARVAASNDLGESCRAAGRIVLDRAGRLAFPGTSDQRAFRAALASAVAVPKVGQVAPPSAFPAFGPDGSRRLARVLPLDARSAGAGFVPKPIAALILSDPWSIRRPAAALSAFGLTQREAELALALASGQTLSEYAGRRGVSNETARSQLKAAMRKLDVRRQAELVRIVSALAASP